MARTRLVTAKDWTLPREGSIAAEGGKRTRSPRDNRKREPFFSVITISLNSAAGLRRCIESVRRQSYKDFEYIVVDGGSTDSSTQLLSENADWMDYYVSQPDGGIYQALNRGLSLSFGRYIIAIHADDYLALDALEGAAETLQASPADIVIGDSIYIDKSGKPVAYKPSRDYGEETTLRGIVGPHEAAFIASETYEVLGGYDETLRIASDFKLLRNAVLSGKKIVSIGKVVNYKEVGGESFDKQRERDENFRLLREVFGNVDDETVAALYPLKNYHKPSREDFDKLYDLLRRQPSLPASLTRSVALALLSHLRGDGPSATPVQTCDGWFSKQNTSRPRVLLTAFRIKGVSGGAERVLTELANYLVQRGYDVWVASADGRSDTPFYDFIQGVRFIDLGEMPHSVRFLIPIAGLEREIKETVESADPQLIAASCAKKESRESYLNWSGFSGSLPRVQLERSRANLCDSIPGWIKKYGNNVARWRTFIETIQPALIIPFMISNIQQVFVATRTMRERPRILLSNHNNPIRDYFNQDEWDSSSLDRLLRFLAVSSADRSHWLLDEYVEHLPPICRSNAISIGNAVRLPSSAASSGNASHTILAVGRLTNVKNFALLIEAFSRLAPKWSNWHVRVFGEGPEQKFLEDLIGTLNVQERVCLMGVTRNIDDEYSKASIFVSTSLVEGFPLTLCEAMSHGLAVLGRRTCSGVNSIVQHNQNGMLYGGSDHQAEVGALAEALQQLMSDGSLRERLGVDARESMKQHSPEMVFGKWERTVFEVLNSASERN